MVETKLVDVVGWAGALAILLAYVLVSSRKMDGGSWVYQMLNLFGGAFLVLNTAWYGAYPSTALNFVWVVIAVVALARYGRQPDTHT